MADSTVVDAFIGATNFCTGSQADYSTCIANNMRFTPFLDDTYEASGFAGLSINKQDLPLIYGDVYVDLKPVAIANIFTRVKMTNSYGGVSFRCSDVFSRPRLPLPRLQDLGIPSQDIINVIGLPPEPEPGEDDPLLFEGVPISPDDSLLGWLFNVINLLIGYTTAVSNTMTKGREVKGTILGMLDYYKLPDLSIEMQETSDSSFALYNETRNYIFKVRNDSTADSLLQETMDVVDYFLVKAESYMVQVRTSINNEVVSPLSIINENTDFTTFDFTITDDVAIAITEQEEDQYPFIFSFSMQAKNSSATYGIPPMYPKDHGIVSKRIVDIYASIIRNTISASLATIAQYYTSSSILELSDKLRADEIFYNYIKAVRAYYTTIPASHINAMVIPNPDDDDLADNNTKYIAIIDQLDVLLDTFAYDNLMNLVDAAYDPEDHESLNVVHKLVDTYYENTGSASSIELYNLVTKQQDLYNTDFDITEIFLGGDYKDAGKFYYADLAYAVGYAKLKDIKSIQINDEYYELTAIVDEDGNPVDGISESGCTKYTFERHVLPTYTVSVTMYIYPGTPDQPYCPTINKYHNFLTSKYAGIFTKMDEGEMGVFVYKGYKPMFATVEEVVKIGSSDINSINLNDPSLDQKAYQTMIMKEIKNLTNASSINGLPLSTEDFKYYLASTLVDDTQAANYPGLAIMEFINMPIGTSSAFPKITVNVIGEDLL